MQDRPALSHIQVPTPPFYLVIGHLTQSTTLLTGPPAAFLMLLHSLEPNPPLPGTRPDPPATKTTWPRLLP